MNDFKEKYYKFDLEKDSLGIGRWGMGSVYKAKLRKTRADYADYVAVKVIPKIGGYSATEDELLKYVDFEHSNIVKYLKCMVKDVEKKPCYHLYMELCTSDMGKELKKRKEEKMPLTNKEFLNIFHGVADGLQHLHNQGLIHRDIKPNNILLKSHGQGETLETQTAKLCDFGVSKLAGDGDEYTLTSKVGTKGYRAPEVMKGRNGSAHYGHQADIFSTGAVMFEAIILEKLVESEEDISEEVERKVNALDDSIFGELVITCLRKEPDQRPTAEQVAEQTNQIYQNTVEDGRPAGSF